LDVQQKKSILIVGPSPRERSVALRGRRERLAGRAVIPDDRPMASQGPHREVLRMRLEPLRARLPAPVWPEGVHVRSFAPADAKALHALLEHGYRRGGGSVPAFEAWLPRMTNDAEFDPDLWFLAEFRATLVGAVLCWTSAFVKDIAVDEAWRRRGIGAALLLHAWGALAARGANRVELKVEADNSSARRLYERLGMRVVPG
jgi:ribosomal protein S18 acetylase RimI-like enzyme